MIRKKPTNRKLVIDLTGPAGNAFAMLALANDLSVKLNFSSEKSSIIQEELMAGDYENLIQVFDNYFGEYVILEK